MTRKAGRTLSALLALATLFLSLPALAGAGDATIYRQEVDGLDSVRAIAYIDSTVYVFTRGSEYYTWDGVLAAHPFDDPDRQGAGGGYTYMQAMIPTADAVYALVVANEPTEERDVTAVGDVTLCPVEFAADGAASLGAGVRLDWSDMIEQYDKYESSYGVKYPFIEGNVLTFVSQGTEQIFAYDLESGAYQAFDFEADGGDVYIGAYFAYRDGLALVGNLAYGDGSDPHVAFYELDLATGEAEEAFRIDCGDAYPGNFAYDAAADDLYYTMSGRLYRMKPAAGAAAEELGAVQVDDWGDMPAILTGDGRYVCADYGTVLIRTADPTARAEKTLTVSTYSAALEEAFFAFSGKYADTDVVLNADYHDFSDITDAMLRQSGAVDIYTLDASSAEFGALMNRGYLTDLSGSARIADLVSETYPDVQAAVSKDGQVLALPVELYAQNLISYDPDALEKLGLTEDDLPKTWAEFFQFLQAMPNRATDGSVLAFEPYETQEQVRRDLFYMLMRSYEQRIITAGVGYDTALLRGLLAALEEVDFAALGLAEEYDEDAVYEGVSVLFAPYGYISASGTADGMRPLLLALDEGEEPALRCELTVAIVNPYSRNKERAIQYLEEATDCLYWEFLLNACPGRNDPVPNPRYEEQLQYAQERIAVIQTELESAEGDDAADWQAQLDEWLISLAEYREHGMWDASAEGIALYREYAAHMAVARALGISGDDAGTFYEPYAQYLGGAIDADAMLKNLDKKLHMMLMEGS